ncbi:MAG TPA: hypothetical protein VFX80_07025 [Solirubrobacteraceae bacterium]|nr:hypothetical protein [Solirubrobacteraceae bacterium]
MRTLGFRTHVLLAVAAAVGVVYALGKPWYAPAPSAAETSAATLGGSTDGIRGTLERLATDSVGTTGWDALGVWGTVLALLAVVTALGALGCLVPGIQGVAREVLRYGGLACFALVAWKVLDHPGDALELRIGAAAAGVAALVACTSGSAVASAPLRRRQRAAAAYAPAPAPTQYGNAGSAPPPGA